MNADSHASKRKSMQPKKRSLRKADEMLSEIKKKKKKIEESSPAPAAPSSEQKPKAVPARGKEKMAGAAENGNSSSIVAATVSGGTIPSCHSNGSVKVKGVGTTENC